MTWYYQHQQQMLRQCILHGSDDNNSSNSCTDVSNSTETIKNVSGQSFTLLKSLYLFCISKPLYTLCTISSIGLVGIMATKYYFRNKNTNNEDE